MSIYIYNDLRITITKGDSALIRLAILLDGDATPFTDGDDQIKFIVKEYPGAPLSIFEVEVEEFIEGVAEISIPSTATANMSVGNYIYGIQWIDEGEIRTIVPGADFADQYPIFEVVPGL